MLRLIAELMESLVHCTLVADATFDERTRSEQQQKHRFENALASVMHDFKTHDVVEILRRLSQQPVTQLDANRVRSLLQAILPQLRDSGADSRVVGSDRHLVETGSNTKPPIVPPMAAQIAELATPHIITLYGQWRETRLPRGLLLAMLVKLESVTAWSTFAELVVADPPTHATEAVEAFLPLWRGVEGDVSQLFPRLWGALGQVSVAVIVLDLANFLFRSGRVTPHPAVTHAAQLVELLGAIVERLEGFESDCRQRGVTDVQVARQVSESVALAVALADTFARMNHHDAMGKLYRMLDLSHRRVRTEAAAALAYLGEETGKKSLVEMAAEPLVRLRVHVYAQELAIFEQIPETYRSEAAVAEAELVMRLAEPDCFGFPPSKIELEDTRELYWPGYESPQTCYLFRFHYALPVGELTNVALARPVAHVCAADLSDLDVEDIYAVFAGWQTEHEELRRIAIDPTLPEHARDIAQAKQRIESLPFTDLQPVFLADYFGTRIVVMTASRAGQAGTLFVTPDTDVWVPQSSQLRPIDADTAFDLFVGRDLLGRFNDWNSTD